MGRLEADTVWDIFDTLYDIIGGYVEAKTLGELRASVYGTAEKIENGEPVSAGPALNVDLGDLPDAVRKVWDWKNDKPKKGNQAERLVALAQEACAELFVDQFGKPHAFVNSESVPLTPRAYDWLRKLLWDAEGAVCNREALAAAVGTLASFAKFGGKKHELHVRSAWYEGKLYYELWQGCVVVVQAGCWCTVQDPPVRFRRVPNLKPLPAPSEAASAPSAAALMAQQDVDRNGKNTNSTINTNICALSSEYVKLKHERDKRLFVAYLVTTLLPHVARPILQFTGVMGSGKSTASRFVKRTVDPSAPETIRLNKPSEVLQKASHAHVLMIDNARGIPDWAEDMLCRLVTGEADSKRQLYTDDDDIIYELMRVVLLNGINVPSERGDVQDRTLPIELDRIPDQERAPEEDMWRRFGEVHPQLLSAIFDVLGAALEVYPSVSMSRTPRLADWGRYAAAVYEVLGWGTTQFLEDWRKVVESQTTAAVEGSPVAQTVVKYMEDRDHYRDTAANLLPNRARVPSGGKGGGVGEFSWGVVMGNGTLGFSWSAAEQSNLYAYNLERNMQHSRFPRMSLVGNASPRVSCRVASV